MNKKICFVVQRYGLEVNGGAELHCRKLAEHMLPYYNNVHVLTTKAIDYITWKNEYECDEEIIHGVYVHRFSVRHQRNKAQFDAYSNRVLLGHTTHKEERQWIEKQGPVVPELIDYLIKKQIKIRR